MRCSYSILCSLLLVWQAAAQAQTASPVLSLSGDGWTIAADPRNPPSPGYEKDWCDKVRGEAVKAVVPGIIQQALPDTHLWVWYWRTFTAPVNANPGGRYLLRFEAVDYSAEVFVSGQRIGGHEGADAPFTLDATDAVQPGKENLLAVRVLNYDDGGKLPNRCKSQSPEWMKYGGITGRVELITAPAVRIESFSVRPDPATGDVFLEALVKNAGSQSVQGRIEFALAPVRESGASCLAPVEQTLPPGASIVKGKLRVGAPHLWSTDDPFLYQATARLAVSGEYASNDQRSARCGFRDFRVGENGYFMLNGKRLFVRSTHTGNHVPGGWVSPPESELMRRDLVFAKASGFNMVRFIATAAWPDQLDLCDELGLMVYEETSASWGLKDSPQVKERFERSLREVVLRDRNHPCVTIWGLLNEEPKTPVFQAAVESLGMLRDCDDTRLVLLSSGRWDRDANVGSVANPGSRQWQEPWSGDIHFYPPVPQSAGDSRAIRGMGNDAKPAFLSEYGIGSLMNVVGETRHFEQAGVRPDLKDASWIRSMAERFEADWKRLGMDGVYAFPEDMLLESQRLHARQRLLGFDLIRANPNLCGFNLTGMLDHGLTGEGLWTFWRQWKPGTFEATADGWAPLRWCLFVDPMHGYAGQPVQVEAVLANEDVLKPGEYPVWLRVLGPEGVAWEKKMPLQIPEAQKGKLPPLAVPVLSEKITLSGPAGAYEFAATMEHGGAPAGGRLRFYVGQSNPLPQLKANAVAWGLSDGSKQWLKEHGIACRGLAAQDAPGGPQVILVGEQAQEPSDAEWKQVFERVEAGATAVFLAPRGLRKGNDLLGRLPLATKGRCYEFNDWLYHKDCVASRHAVFAGLQAPGVMDWDYYGEMIGHTMFEGQATPDEVFAATFAAGYGAYYPGSPCPTGYTSGVVLGAYNVGKGRIILNAFRILENLGRIPAADRLLLNLVIEAGKNQPRK